MRTSLTISLLVLASLGASSTMSEPPVKAPRVLFVGNSLTYVNDLPSIVERISVADGAPLETHTAVAPNYGLEDHWNDGAVQRLLGRERWDVVVLQQGPSSLQESGTNLVDYAARFGALIRSHHACPAVYMVWSEERYPRMFDAVRDHHRAAADSAHAQFLPAGDGWRAAWRRDPSFAFYSPDGLHPTPLGSYLAALVVYGGITGRSPVGDTTSVAGMVIDRTQHRVVQEAAAEVLRDVPRRCGVD
ncbi:MAG: hypothetical protein ABJB33_07190 [Gemmatimonadota bacterium]